jgi:DUF4097 and DUF4098 domain-containing protein YvlB
MSWLYSIVFAGLMFSSGGDTVPERNEIYTNVNTPTRVVLANETERFEQTYPLSANGTVNVSNVNGSITVEAWDRNEVKLEAIKTADSKETLSEMEIQIESKPNSFCVQAEHDSWKNRNNGEKWTRNRKMEVQFHLTVPRTAILSGIETVNGSVIVSNFTNQTNVSAVNGQVTATNLRGAANLSTVNGTVVADFDRLEPGSKISLETVNGKVNLTIPSDSSAMVKAESVNGNITNDFGLPVRKGKYVGRDLYGKLGSGDTNVKLESVNGELAILKKKDGKTSSPAVDLLPQKSKDDEDEEDWDKDDDNDTDTSKNVRIDTDKLNKHIEKSVMKAQKDLEKFKPEIEKIDVEAIKKAAESIDTEKIREQVREDLERQRAARIRDANWEGATPVIEKKTNSFTVKGIPKVTIDAKGCEVKITGWDKQEVRYVVTKVASSRAPSPIVLTDMQDNSGVTLKVVNKDAAAQAGFFSDDIIGVRVEVLVPKKSDLKIITNGEIRLEGVTGDIDLTGANEAINVRDSGGTLHLISAEARVRIVGFKGALDAVTGEGEMYLEGDFEKLSATASDGNIILTLPEDGNADIESDVEAISIAGLPVPKEVSEGHWRFGRGGAKYKFTVGNGDVLVRNLNTIKGNQ